MVNKWKEYSLSEIYEFRSGLSKSRSEFGSGYGFLSFKDVFYNFFVPNDLSELVNSTKKERDGCSVKKGDVFLTRTSETFDELGMSCVALKDYEDVTFNGFCKRLRPKNMDMVVPEYAGYYFRNKFFRNAVTSMSTMSTRASLNNEMLEKLTIILPSIDEQKSIGHILKRLDDKIELNRQMNQTLEQMAQALFKSWFVDFDPVIDNAFEAGNKIPEELQNRARQRMAIGDKRKPLPNQIKSLFPNEFEYSDEIDRWMPKGWEVCNIEEIANVVGGGTPSTKITEYYTDNGIAWLSPKDLSGCEWKFISRGATDITELGLQKSSARLMPKGTVLFSSRAPIGYVAIAENEITTNQGFKSLIPNDGVPSEYLYYFLKANTESIEAIATGSTFKEVSGTALKGLKIIKPPFDILKHYNDKTTPFNEKRRVNQKEVITLSNVRDTLLPKLISGELSVESFNMPIS